MKKILGFVITGAAVFLAFLAALPCRCRADDTVIAIDPIGDSGGYTGILYDNSNGLPTSEANAIAETADGFIWIGSYSGLIRYDGNTFDRIDSTTGIASVVSLFVDSKERLWVGTNDSGAAVYEKGEFRMYGKEDGLQSLSIRSITEDPEGNIYLATTHGIAVIDKNMELDQLDSPQINDDYIYSLAAGNDGILYGVTREGALLTVEDGKVTGFYEGSRLGVDSVRSVLPDPDAPGYVYVGTNESEIYRGRLQDGLANPAKIFTTPLASINSMQKYNGDVWICADNGIGILEGTKLTVLKNIPLENSVEQVMVDYQGNLWFASSKQGVMKSVPNQFTDVFVKYNIPETVVNTTCVYNGRLFAGCKNTGLLVLDQNGRKESLSVSNAVTASGKDMGSVDLIGMFDECNIRSIIRDGEDRIWISSFGEIPLARYDGRGLLCFTKDDGLPSDRIRTVCERQDGSFIAACSGGIAVIRDDKVEEVYDKEAGINDSEILTVVEGDNKDIIAGTDGSGIYVIKESQVMHLGIEDGLSSEVVMRIKKDEKRKLYWIVTSNSIAYMDEDYKISTIRKFPYPNNFDLYENSNGEMWILSSNGVYVVPVDELIRNEEITPAYYGMDNGLPCITTSNSYSDLTGEGELYIAGTTGIAMVNIDKTMESVGELKVDVPFVDADGTRLYPDADGAFVIPADTSKLTIYSYVFTYSLMNPLITYQLTGFDKEGVTIRRSELVPVDYTNLKGGNYSFDMELRDSRGMETQLYSFPIIKTRAFYEYVWFNILAALLLILAAVYIIRLVIKQKTLKYKKKVEEEKTIIRDISRAFAKTIDMKDRYTTGHSYRVAKYTAMLAKELGYDEDTVDRFYDIALLHDVGKIGVSPQVLNKPGKLTDEEFLEIKSHAKLGYNALKDIKVMPELADGAGFHHERPDGRGYPSMLKGDDIPRVAQIIAVADTFDAMYSDRPYRKRMNYDKAVSIIQEVSGTQLMPDVVDAFMRIEKRGEFKAADDDGGGSIEDITNIRTEKGSADPVT